MYRSRRGRKASIYRSNYTLIRRRSPRSNSPYTISRKRVRKILSHILPDSNALAVMSSTTMHWGSDITRSLKRGVKIPADTRRGMKRRRMSLHMGNLMAGTGGEHKVHLCVIAGPMASVRDNLDVSNAWREITPCVIREDDVKSLC